MREVTPPADVRITNIALAAELADHKGRTTVKLVYLPFGDSDSEDEEDEEDEDGNDDEGDEHAKATKAPNPTQAVICTLILGQVS